MRGIKYATLKPHLKDQNVTEEKLFPLYFEKKTTSKIDLVKYQEEVEQQKQDIWQKVNAAKQALA